MANLTGKEAVNISQLKMFVESLTASGGSGSEWEFLWLTIKPGDKLWFLPCRLKEHRLLYGPLYLL